MQSTRQGIRIDMTNQPTTTKEALEPTLEDLAIQAAALLDSLPTYVSDNTIRHAQQIAFALRERVKNSRVSAPIVALEVDDTLCLLCGHKGVAPDGTCMAPVPICSDDYHGTRQCGCKCRFRAPAATVAPQEKSVAARCPDCGARLTSDFDEDVGMWEECTECDYRNMLSNRSAPASPAALRDEADTTNQVFATADEFLDAYNAAATANLLNEIDKTARQLLRPNRTATDIEFAVDYIVSRTVALRRSLPPATTPPSTLAKAAAEEIVAELDRRAWLFDSHGARPIASGKAAYMEQVVAAIIERCLAGGGESTQKVEGGNK